MILGLGRSPVGWAWQPSPIFRLENPHGQRSLAGCSPWGRKEWDRLPTPVFLGFPGSSVSKESACNSGDVGSVPEFGRSPAGGHGNSLQYSRLENPHGQRSQAGCHPWGSKELDTTERLSTAQHSTGARWGFPDGSVVKSLPAMQVMQETWVGSLGQEDHLEEEMATHSRTLA